MKAAKNLYENNTHITYKIENFKKKNFHNLLIYNFSKRCHFEVINIKLINLNV